MAVNCGRTNYLPHSEPMIWELAVWYVVASDVVAGVGLAVSTHPVRDSFLPTYHHHGVPPASLTHFTWCPLVTPTTPSRSGGVIIGK